MTFFSVLHIFCGCIYLVLGLYAVRLENRSRVNAVFFFLCLCFAIWTFSFAFLHDPTMSEDQRHFWYNLSSFGWCLFPGTTLHLVFFLTRRSHLMKKAWIWLLLYGPGAFCVYLEFSGVLASRTFVWVGVGVHEVPPVDRLRYWFFFVYQIGVALLSIILLYHWGRSTHIKRERRQSRIIVRASILTMVIASITDIVLPVAEISVLPSLSPIVSLILAYGFWLSIFRYKLMSFTLTRASDDIVMRMRDVLMLLKPDGTIVRVNPRVTDVLGYEENTLIGGSCLDLLGSDVGVIETFERLSSSKEMECRFDADVLTVTGERIPMSINASMLLDQFKDPIGIVMLCIDIRERRRLQEEIRERQQTEEHLRQRNVAIEWDLENAKVSQRAILPNSAPIHARVLTDYRYFPMASVGGDYFTFIPFKTGELGVFIGDVSGHGVSAALFLLLLKAEFDRACRESGLEPGHLITSLNGTLTGTMHQYFLTAQYGYFDVDRSGSPSFTFANGGHPEPILFRAATGRVELLHLEGPLLGKFDDAAYHQSTIELAEGDRIFLMTDGLFETRNTARELFTQSALLKLVEAVSTPDLHQTLDAIFSVIERFRGAAAIEDDIILIGFEIRPDSPDSPA